MTLDFLLTFELRGEHGGGFGGQEDLLGVLGESSALVSGQHQGAQEAHAVTDVVVLVVLGEVEHVLTQQPRLFGVGDAQLGRQVEDLQLDDVLLATVIIILSVN